MIKGLERPRQHWETPVSKTVYTAANRVPRRMKHMDTIQLAPTPDQTRTSPSLRINLPPSSGRGGLSIESFRSGLQFRMMDLKLERTTRIKSNSAGFKVGVGFCLDGFFKSGSALAETPVQVKPNMSGFFFYPELMDIRMTVGCLPMVYSVITMELETFGDLVQNSQGGLGPIIKQVEKGAPFFIPDVLTPAMRMVFHQIVNCPYTGSIRQLYLEGKVMELLSQKLDQLRTGATAGSPNAPGLTPADIDRIRYAAELLIRDLEYPPDMATLARAAGLSRRSLYRYFNQVYGVPPVTYLRHHRLMAAMELLQTGRANVTEAAIMVGYSNLSHFAKSFKSMFGVLPGDFLNQAIPAAHTPPPLCP